MTKQELIVLRDQTFKTLSPRPLCISCKYRKNLNLDMMCFLNPKEPLEVFVNDVCDAWKEYQ